MTRDEIKDSIAAYCLGALDPEEKKAVEEQIASGDAEILKIYNEMMQVTSALPYKAPAKKPPRRLKQSILAAMESEQKPETQQVFRAQRETRSSFGLGLALAIAVAVVLALGVYSAVLKSEMTTLRNQLALSQELLTGLRDKVSAQERVLNVMQSPELIIINLAGSEVSPTSKGKVFWDTQQNRAVFYAYNLPELPSDKDYQLWMLRDDQSEPVSAGVFSLNEEGIGRLVLNVISETQNLNAFTVSQEPKGGMPQPTGDIYLIGNITGG